MSIDGTGVFFYNKPRSATPPILVGLEWFSGDDRFVDLRLDYRFLVGSFFGILRTVPNRFLSGLVRCMSNCSATCR